MKIFTSIFLMICIAVSRANGHGLALYVEIEDSRLIVKHSEPSVFAPPIFAQNNTNDEFAEALELPRLGDVVLWDKPGLDIHGPDGQYNLSIEVLSRPVIGSPSAEKRALWYWDPLDGAVEPSSNDLHLLGTGQRYTTIDADSVTAPDPFLLANTLAGQTGFHNHGLLNYALDNNQAAAAGIYGFFARLMSNGYAASDPFLVLFNYSVTNQQLQQASLAIHEAATLPGDFDLDNDVDGRDFLLWQQLAGSTTRTVADASLNGIVDTADLAIWQENYGTRFGAVSTTAAMQVPEPTTLPMLIILAALANVYHRRRFALKSAAHHFGQKNAMVA